jgi:transcriptional regulator with XRE-family HTH domain
MIAPRNAWAGSTLRRAAASFLVQTQSPVDSSLSSNSPTLTKVYLTDNIPILILEQDAGTQVAGPRGLPSVFHPRKNELRIGEILCRLRKTRGLSQEEMAHILGFSASYLSLLERGKRPATMQVLRTLASWLGVPPGLLLLQSMDPSALDVHQQKLVTEVETEFQKALAANDFAALQRILQS